MTQINGKFNDMSSADENKKKSLFGLARVYCNT
jgi:hypothetical protein